MDITRTEALREAARLDASPALSPKTKAGCDELVDCLMRNCQDAEHAKLVMTQLLDDVSRCQSLTAEIAAIAKATRKRPVLPDGCERCKGEPFVPEPCFTGGASEVKTANATIRAWVRCSCARGQALKKGLEAASS